MLFCRAEAETARMRAIRGWMSKVVWGVLSCMYSYQYSFGVLYYLLPVDIFDYLLVGDSPRKLLQDSMFLLLLSGFEIGIRHVADG